MEEELVRARNGRMVRRQTTGRLVIPQHLVERLQESTVIHDELEAQRRRVARDWAVTSAAWIAANLPDLTFGVPPKLSAISPQTQQASLAEFEYAYKGNAVCLVRSSEGEVWWLDPEGRSVSTHVFATRCSERSGYAVEYEIHFGQK